MTLRYDTTQLLIKAFALDINGRSGNGTLAWPTTVTQAVDIDLLNKEECIGLCKILKISYQKPKDILKIDIKLELNARQNAPDSMQGYLGAMSQFTAERAQGKYKQRQDGKKRKAVPSAEGALEGGNASIVSAALGLLPFSTVAGAALERGGAAAAAVPIAGHANVPLPVPLGLAAPPPVKNGRKSGTTARAVVNHFPGEPFSVDKGNGVWCDACSQEWAAGYLFLDRFKRHVGGKRHRAKAGVWAGQQREGRSAGGAPPHQLLGIPVPPSGTEADVASTEEPSAAPRTPGAAASSADLSPPPSKTLKGRLSELNEALEAGFVTQAEYDNLKGKIFDVFTSQTSGV